MFTSLGAFAHRRPWEVLLVTGALVVLGIVWGPGLFAQLTTAGYGDPDTESQRADRILAEEFGDFGVDAVVVYSDEAGSLEVDSPAFERSLARTIESLPEEHVEDVVGYLTPDLTSDERAMFVSEDRRATYIALDVAGQDEDERLASYQALLPHLDAEGLVHHTGGELTSHHQLQRLAMSDLLSAQLIMLPVLLVLLVVIFRGLVAALVPLVLGVLSILGSLVLLRVLTPFTEISIFAVQISIMLGLGLAVDYGLFIVSRFRDELARHGDVATALPTTVATAGRTVAFSGITVVAALSGLLLLPQPVSVSFGLGGMAVVLLTILSAIVVLPALLAVLGPRINALRLPWPRYLPNVDTSDRHGLFARIARRVMRRPVVWLSASGVLLLVMAASLLTLNPGQVNHRYLPQDDPAQVSSRILADDFPDGGPADAEMSIAVRGEVSNADLRDYTDRLDSLDGVTAAQVEETDAGLARISVGHEGDPDDPANLELVREIREQAEPDGATEVLVGGAGGPAATLDNNTSTLGALPGVLVYIAGATYVLLMVAFRSVLLPIKAVVLGFGSLMASLGVLTWGIQEGGFAPVLGFSPVGTTDVWTYAIVVVIAFGLITDYEMFIVSRTREEYLATGDTPRSIAVGVQRTGGIITSAALLMVVVLGTTGAASSSLVITTIGIGLALTVALDSTLVRILTVPASMKLFGDLNWWMPRRRPGPREVPDAHAPHGTPE